MAGISPKIRFWNEVCNYCKRYSKYYRDCIKENKFESEKCALYEKQYAQCMELLKLYRGYTSG